MTLTAAITAVAIAVGSVASLLLHLYQTRWSQRAQWHKKLRELEDACKKADREHETALIGSDGDALARAEHEWMSAVEALAAHRRAGQQAGFSG
jgi:hypothetical protein